MVLKNTKQKNEIGITNWKILPRKSSVYQLHNLNPPIESATKDLRTMYSASSTRVSLQNDFVGR